MKRLIIISLTAFLAASCFKDEPKNSECDILSAKVDAELSGYFWQPSQMTLNNIPSNESDIVFSVRSASSLPKSIAVTFTLTPGATVSPENGSGQDFTEGPVTYTVTSEDGRWSRTYRVSFVGKRPVFTNFSFEHYEAVLSGYSASYHVFYEEDASGQKQNIWASGNEGVAMMHSGWTPELFPTRATSDGYSGAGVCLTTQSAGSLGKMVGKPIAAGNLFIGRFAVDKVLTDALKTTDFGMPISRQPSKVTGWYKYTPGPEFTDKNMKTVSGRTDVPSIYAVFWRNADDDGNPVKLYGDTVQSSPYIVSMAQAADLPATDVWTRFEMTFEGGLADADILASLGYSFTLVFSSSKGGDLFEGAIGSTLQVDQVEISYL